MCIRDSFVAMGADVDVRGGYIHAKAKNGRMCGTQIYLDIVSAVSYTHLISLPLGTFITPPAFTVTSRVAADSPPFTSRVAPSATSMVSLLEAWVLVTVRVTPAGIFTEGVVVIALASRVTSVYLLSLIHI